MSRPKAPEDASAPHLLDLCLADFVHAASPELDPPWHLKPILDVFERIGKEKIRAVVSCPPQHGKTALACHAVAKHLGHRPANKWSYLSNAALLAQNQSRSIRRLYQLVGRMSDEMNTIAQWQTYKAGGLFATGFDGQITGQPITHCIVDDPYKNREEAESIEYRDKVSEVMRSVILPRIWPGGAVVVIATRWHEDDESGRLIQKGWDQINLPAIDDNGCALWPERKGLDYLLSLRDPGTDQIDEHNWQSLFMGQPRPRSGQLFGDPHHYAEVPPSGQRHVIGVDLAYSKGAGRDWAVAIALTGTPVQYMDVGHGGAVVQKQGWLVHVRRVWRVQGGLIEKEAMLREAMAYAPSARLTSYVSGPEVGELAHLSQKGIRIVRLPARYNKFVRAQKTAAHWRAGRVMVPEEAPWLRAFVDEVRVFSGSPSDVFDDQVDALVSGVDFLYFGSSWSRDPSFLTGHRRM